MSFHYLVYGLRIRADRAIAGLTVGRSVSRADVNVHLGSTPTGWRAAPAVTRPARRDRGFPEAVTRQSDRRRGYRLRYADGTTFVVDCHGDNIWADWPSDLTLEDTAVYLLGPVLAFVLRVRGVTCLHASAFCVDGHAVALTGPSGAGKSTTAAAFADRGLPVLTDDLLAIEDSRRGVMAQPGYPRLRLWPDSTAILYGAPAALPRLTPNWDKRYLPLGSNGRRFEHRTRPLGAIYVLGAPSSDPAAPLVEPLPARAGLVALIANARGDYHPDRASHRREFATLGKTADRVPVRRVIPRAGPASLERLCDIVLEDIHALTGRAIEADTPTCTI